MLSFEAMQYMQLAMACDQKDWSVCVWQERPGLVVLTIELEKALSQTGGNMQLTKTWSPYRDPLAKFLNKYSREVKPICFRVIGFVNAASQRLSLRNDYIAKIQLDLLLSI